jgi:hypothetical protein
MEDQHFGILASIYLDRVRNCVLVITRTCSSGAATSCLGRHPAHGFQVTISWTGGAGSTVQRESSVTHFKGKIDHAIHAILPSLTEFLFSNLSTVLARTRANCPNLTFKIIA